VNDTLEASDIRENADDMFDYLNEWLLRIRYSNWKTPISKGIKVSKFRFSCCRSETKESTQCSTVSRAF
jgi:hypothetical protein